jgi:hypothetical protein
MSVHEYARRERSQLANDYPRLRPREYRIRMYALGGRRKTETVFARGLMSAVRLAETLNPDYVATVVEA